MSVAMIKSSSLSVLCHGGISLLLLAIAVFHVTDCIDITNVTSGTVSSPGYPSSYGRPLDLSWRIVLPETSRIKVIFSSPFGIDTAHLGYDFLYVYDGGDEDADLIKKYPTYTYTYNPPFPFITHANQLYIRFITRYPGYGSGSGFQFTFSEETNKGASFFNQMHGLLVTDNYPGGYLNNEKYSWFISVPDTFSVRLIFTDWNIKNGDHLMIYEGDVVNNTRIWMLTYAWLNPKYGIPNRETVSSMPDIQLNSNKAYLTLDTAQRFGNLAVHFQAVDLNKCPTPYAPVHGSISGSDYHVGSAVSFSCDHLYTMIGEPRIVCSRDDKVIPFWTADVPQCLGDDSLSFIPYWHDSTEVRIVFPDPSLSYGNSYEHRWYVRAAIPNRYKITSDSMWLDPANDRLNVYDGARETSTVLISYTGEGGLNALYSTGADVLVKFTTKAYAARTQFTLHFDASEYRQMCGQTFINESGTFEVTNISPHLWRDLVCDWIIKVPEGNMIEFRPIIFDIPFGGRVLFSENSFSQRPVYIWWMVDPPSCCSMSRTALTNLIYVRLNTFGQPYRKDMQGLKFSYKAMPMNSVINATMEGFITAPNYPEDTVENAQLWWNLTAPTSYRIAVHFVPIVYSIRNLRHFLVFYELINGNLTIIKNITGYSRNPAIEWDFVSETEDVYISFTSDRANGLGFKLQYKAFSSTECPPVLIDNGNVVGPHHHLPGDMVTAECNYGYRYGDMTNVSLTCLDADENSTFPHWDGVPFITCVRDKSIQDEMTRHFHETITMGTGFVHPQHEKADYLYRCSYSNRYLSNQTSEWLFDLADQYVVILWFEKFYDINTDSLVMYDGNDTSADVLINCTRAFQRYGNCHPSYTKGEIISSTSNKFLIRFVSQNKACGFRLKYIVVPRNGCYDPPISQFGWRILYPASSVFYDGSVITYGCFSGYELHGNDTLTCNGSSHSWIGDTPECRVGVSPETAMNIHLGIGRPVRLYSPNFPNYYPPRASTNQSISTVDGKGIQFDRMSTDLRHWTDSIVFSEDGMSKFAWEYPQQSWYAMKRLNQNPDFLFRSLSNSVEVRLCATNHYGRTSKGYQYLLRVYDLPEFCQVPLPIKNGMIEGKNYTPGSTIHYVCDPGYYILTNDKQARCMDGNIRHWDIHSPRCVAPCGRNLTNTEGLILSENWPNVYSPNIVCTWTIEGEIGTVIELNFTQLDLQSSRTPSYNDYFTITQSYGEEQIFHGQSFFRGKAFFRSTSHQVAITLTANDRLYNYKPQGFHTEFRVFHPYACSPLPHVAHSKMKVYPSDDGDAVVVYTCLSGFTLIGSSNLTCLSNASWDQPAVPKCQGLCGGAPNELSGRILSPDYPGNYSNNQECAWILNSTEPGIGYKLDLTDVSLADGDILEVYDVPVDGSYVQPVAYVWPRVPTVFVGSTLQLTLILKTGSHDITEPESCNTDPACQCRETDDGNEVCEKKSLSMHHMRACIEKYSNTTMSMGEYEREMNCTIEQLSAVIAEMFGGLTGNYSADISSLNCTCQDNNQTLPDSVIQCVIEQTPSQKCLPACRSRLWGNNTYKFNIGFETHALGLCPPYPVYTALSNGFIGAMNPYRPIKVGQTFRLRCNSCYVFQGNAYVTCIRSKTWSLFNARCSCDSHFTALTGHIYPFQNVCVSRYRNNMHCKYTIVVPEVYRIRLKSSYIYFKQNDSLVIYDGPSSSSSILAQYSGVRSDDTVVLHSSKNQLFMRLDSDESYIDKGFHIYYEAYIPCPYPEVPINGTVTLVPSGSTPTLFSIGEQVEFTCNPDSGDLEGEAVLTCIYAGEGQARWNYPLPKCTISLETSTMNPPTTAVTNAVTKVTQDEMPMTPALTTTVATVTEDDIRLPDIVTVPFTSRKPILTQYGPPKGGTIVNIPKHPSITAAAASRLVNIYTYIAALMMIFTGEQVGIRFVSLL